MKNFRVKSNSSEEERKSLNTLAREQLKLKLLTDLRMDIEICKLEGWDYKQYLFQLKDIIDCFLI